MIYLFQDQAESIDKLRDAMRRYKRVLLQGETGSGKSVMASYMIASSLTKNKKSAFVVPRKELLRQMSETFDEFKIPHSYVAAGNPFNPYSRAHVCTVGSLVNRKEKIKPDVIFFDETHHGDGQLDELIKYYAEQGAWIVGLTATPDNPRLPEWYEHMICGPTIPELIETKRLSSFRYFAPSTPDLSGIKIVGGEYAKGQLNDYMMQQRVLVGDAVKHYRDHAMGRLNMAFCTSIKHSQMVAASFRDAGVPAVHIDGDTPENERRRIARDFALRNIKVLTSVDLVLFGYDLASASGIKGANVECISDLRPTKSRNVQRQKIGRVLRYKDYPALIFDHSGNYTHHGLPNEVIEWTLEPKVKKRGGERVPPTRQCEKCFHIYSPAPACPECGHIYEIKSREIDEIDGELSEIDIEKQRLDKRMEEGRAQTLEQLIEIGRNRGYKNPGYWAAKKLAGRMMRK